MKTIKINCPACDQKLELPASLRGTGVECPNCQRGFVPPGRAPLPSRKKFLIGGAAALVGGLIWLTASNPDVGGLLVMLFLLASGILIYFAPSVVAARREHRQLEAIFILNLLAGWTLIGWVAAAVWAHTNPR